MILLTSLVYLFGIFAPVCMAFSSELGDVTKMLPNDGISRELVELIRGMANTIDTLNDRVVKLEHLENKVVSFEKEMLVNKRRLANMERRIRSRLSSKPKSEDTADTLVEDQQNRERAQASKSKRQVTQPTSPSHTATSASILHWQDPNRPPVAFSAVLSNTLTHVNNQHTIAFEDVVLNEGQAYDVTSGIFTAPYPGIYLFIYNLGHWGDDETMLELMKNGKRVNALAVEGSQPEQNLQGGNAAILHLDQGDRVWVEMFFKIDSSALHIYTTFSGAILF